MFRRFPLYLKILAWFFLNVGLLAAVGLLLLQTQFRFRLDWLLTGSAGQRVEAMADAVLGELRERPLTEWDAVLKRFGAAYRLDMAVFRPNGEFLAGAGFSLPAELRVRFGRQAEGGVTPPGADLAPGMGPRRPSRLEGGPRHSVDQPPSPPELPRPLHTKFLVHGGSPPSYFLAVRFVLPEPQLGRPVPALLVARSDTLSVNGLLFDILPWVYAGLSALVISALFWIPLVRGITKSLGQMSAAARQIADGQFDARVEVLRRDELGELGAAINRMATRLEHYLAGQKRFLGDIAHELCSPLAKLQVALGILEQRSGPQHREYSQIALGKAEEISTLVNELLSFSKASLGASIRLVPIRVGEIVGRAVEREVHDTSQIQVKVPEELHIMGDQDLLVRALANLLRNALRYAGDAGPIQVNAQIQEHEVWITVADQGPGVPESQLPNLFDPFFRADQSRDRSTGGVGLGLTIVKTCVESCGGTVRCRNLQPRGFEVALRFSPAESVPPEVNNS